MFKKISLFVLCLMIFLAPLHSYAESNSGSHKAPKSTFSKDDVSTVTGGAYSGGDDPIYMQLPPLIVPFISDRGAQQIVSMIIDLHVDTQENAELLKGSDPILKDALFVAIYGGLADGTMRNSHALNIVAIKEMIKKTVNQMFKKDLILDVLIQGVAQRKL